jgi:hypothetical protein
MTNIEEKLRAALVAHVSLRKAAEELIERYITPGTNGAHIIAELVMLFDGEERREAQRLGEVALGDTSEAVT